MAKNPQSRGLLFDVIDVVLVLAAIGMLLFLMSKVQALSARSALYLVVFIVATTVTTIVSYFFVVKVGQRGEQKKQPAESVVIVEKRSPSERQPFALPRELFELSWRSFTRKAIMATIVLLSAGALLSITLGEPLPPNWQNNLKAILVALVVGIPAFTFANGSLSALRERKRLQGELSEAWKQVRSLNEEKEHLLGEKGSLRALSTLSSHFYGLVYYEYAVSGELHEDGSFGIKYTTDLAATIDQIDGIERFTQAPHAPEVLGVPIGLEAEAEEWHEFAVKLLPEVIREEPKTLFWKLRFVPDLPVGKRLRYSFVENLPPDSFAMTLEEMKRRDLRWEYFYVRISCPTEFLDFSVVLPPNFLPKQVNYDVWFGYNAKIKHFPEYDRIFDAGGWTATLEDDRLCLQLKVNFPIHGLVYAVKWQPPCEDNLARLV